MRQMLRSDEKMRLLPFADRNFIRWPHSEHDVSRDLEYGVVAFDAAARRRQAVDLADEGGDEAVAGWR